MTEFQLISFFFFNFLVSSISNSLPIIPSAAPTSNFSDSLLFNASISQIQDGNAVLLTDDFNMIEFPLIFLPKKLRKGNLVTFKIERDCEAEEKRKNKIEELQKRILGKE